MKYGRGVRLANMIRICYFAFQDSLSALDPFVYRYHNGETDQYKNEDYTMPQNLLVS